MDQLGVKPQIKGRYDLREVEPSDYNIYKCILKKQTLPNGYITQVDLN